MGLLLHKKSSYVFSMLDCAMCPSLVGGEFSILALRQAEALQKWKEITQSVDRKSTRLNSSHRSLSRMPSSA